MLEWIRSSQRIVAEHGFSHAALLPWAAHDFKAPLRRSQVKAPGFAGGYLLDIANFFQQYIIHPKPSHPGNPAMLAISPELVQRYEARLVQQNVIAGQRPHYHKWLRYYLDFCHKYGFAPADCQSLPAFQEKLRAKRQPGPHANRPSTPYRYIGRWFLRPLPSRALRRIPLSRRELPRLGMFLAP